MNDGAQRDILYHASNLAFAKWLFRSVGSGSRPGRLAVPTQFKVGRIEFRARCTLPIRAAKGGAALTGGDQFDRLVEIVVVDYAKRGKEQRAVAVKTATFISDEGGNLRRVQHRFVEAHLRAVPVGVDLTHSPTLPAARTKGNGAACGVKSFAREAEKRSPWLARWSPSSRRAPPGAFTSIPTHQSLMRFDAFQDGLLWVYHSNEPGDVHSPRQYDPEPASKSRLLR